jgi:hypothetical protein
MEVRVRGLSYGLLLSHIFPGLLLEVEILVTFQFFTRICIFDYLRFLTQNGISSLLIVFLIAVFVFATLLGFVIDGVHHFFYEDKGKEYLLRLKGKYDKQKRESLEKEHQEYLELFNRIDSMKDMSIYRSLIQDDYWYPYEGYANIGFAMLPGFVLLPYWLFSRLHAPWFFSVFVLVVYVLITIILLYEAWKTLEVHDEAEKKFITRLSDKSKPNA